MCLTVVDIKDDLYTVTAIKEALERSNLGVLKVGDKVNLERSMIMNGRLDGHIVQGQTQADESMLTGESMPVAKTVGDAVTGGSLNGEGAVQVRVQAVGTQSTLNRIIALVQDAQATKPPVQRLVDKVAAVFVPVVLLIALATLASAHSH